MMCGCGGSDVMRNIASLSVSCDSPHGSAETATSSPVDVYTPR